MDFNGDGQYEAFEKKDLVFIAENASKQIKVLDISNPNSLRFFREITVKDSNGIIDIALNEKDQTLALTDLGLGFVVLDMTFSQAAEPEVKNRDRILQTIQMSGSSQKGMLLDKDLNIAYVAQEDKGIDVVRVGNTRVTFVYKITEGGTVRYEEVIKIAPQGVRDADNPLGFPAEIYVMAYLPAGGENLAVKADVWSLNAAGGFMVPADNNVNTYIKDLPLVQLSSDPGSEYYNAFLSEPIRVTLRPHENLGSRKLLSGDWLQVRLSPEVAGFYQADEGGAYTAYSRDFLNADTCESAADRKMSVRADLVDRPENFEDPGQEKTNSPANNPAIYSGVYLHSGEFVHEDVDLHIPGRGFDFVFQRTYRSQALYPGVLGWNWDHNYNKRLLEWTNGDVIYYDGSGRRERFVYGTRGYTAPKGWFTELKKMTDGTFRFMYPDRTIEFFDAYGRLAAIRDTNGNQMLFYYNLAGQLAAVMDTMGRLITFEYYPFVLDTDNTVLRNSMRLKTITDFSGRTVTFTYDAATGDLKKVDFMGRVKKYVYSQDTDIKLGHNLEQIIDPRGAAAESPVLTVIYTTGDEVQDLDYIELDQNVRFSTGSPSASVTDAKGHVKSFNIINDHPKAVTSGGYTTYFDYNDDGLVTKVTYPAGNMVWYNYDSGNSNRRSQANLLSMEHESTDGSLTTGYEYETTFNQATKVTDPKQNITTMAYNGRGNVQSVALPGVSQPYSYEYDSVTGQLETVTDPKQSVTKYDYYAEETPSGDGSKAIGGRPLNTTSGGYLKQVILDEGTDKDNISQQPTYDMLGNLLQSIDGEGVKTTYEDHNPFGQPTKVTRGATASADGQPAVNHITNLVYDDNGNLTKETHISKGITVDYVYDRLNRLTSKTITGGAFVQQFGYAYDNNSNLKEVTDPMGNKVTYTYNERDLVDTVTRGQGAESSLVSYTYTANGQVDTFTDGENHTYTYDYDGYGRLKDVEDPLGNIVTYGYDENSNVTSVDGTGADDAVINYAYEYNSRDLLTHRKVQTTGGAFITTQYGYDDAGNVETVTPPNNHAWTITPTGSGLTKSIVDPKGNSYTNTYDKRGWLKQVDEEEAGGRQLTRNFNYNVLGKPNFNGDSVGRNYNFTYDIQKQLPRWVRDPESRDIIEYEYDGLHRLMTETRHIHNPDASKDTTTKRYQYDLNNNLRYITDQDNNTTEYIYDTKNRLTDIKYPGTTGSIHMTYNKNDQIHTYTDLNGTLVTHIYDAAGRLERRDIAPGAGIEGTTFESFAYDGLNRLLTADNNHSQVEYVYNTEGRKEKEILRLKDEAENVIAAYETQYAYNDVFNEVTITYPSNRTVTVKGDELYRVSEIKAEENSQEKTVASYGYEGAGKVVQKNLQNAVTMTSQFDDGRRPETLTYTGAGGETFFNKSMQWNLLDMKNHDLDQGNGLGKNYKYDSALRLREVTDTEENTEEDFAIDGNENVDQVTETKQGVPYTTGYSYNNPVARQNSIRR